VLGAALATGAGVMGAALQIAMHAVGKITLFFCAGAILVASHKTRVSELDGIGRRMPWTMGAFALGALSLIGIPPAAGFLSKWLMFQGAASAGHWPALAVLALSTILNAAYFLPIVHAAFLRAPRAGDAEHGEAPLPMVAALTLTAAATIAFPLIAGVPLALAGAVGGIAP
jgi:multicomponent Na+:H+ antiporter subunit D